MGWHLHWKQAVMKKIIVLILIFFSICAGCLAQEAETDDVSAPETEIVVPETEIVVPEPVEGVDTEALDENPEESEPENTDDTPALEKKPLSLEYPERAEIERFRKQYLDPKWTKVLYDALENAIDYRLYIRKALADAELPPELEYLPIVESNYKTNAKSRSGALGLWQFMTNSVRPFLTLNDYVDERLDPWKETDAAIKKLKENYAIFGDWFLAIGAYNCGAGAMTRALAKAEEKDFSGILIGRSAFGTAMSGCGEARFMKR